VNDFEKYIPVENIRNGMLVKTLKHGYKPVTHIGKGRMVNVPGDRWNTMYKHKENGLIITGNHGVLLDTLTSQEAADQLYIMKVKQLPTIEGKYLIFANMCEQYEQITNTNTYTYYHFALEDSGDHLKKYGIWANGILAETTSRKKFLNHGYEHIV
jgi:hypothetical protein